MNRKSLSSKPGMTRKEALAILHKVYKAGGIHIFDSNASEEAKTLRTQVHKAFDILDVAIHGPEAGLTLFGLCEFCYLQVSCGVRVQVKGDCFLRPCCPTCKELLQVVQKIERIDEGLQEEEGDTC